MRQSKAEVCPKCGQQGYRVVKRIKGEEYVYYDHNVRVEGGRWRTKSCYLGPVGLEEKLKIIRDAYRLALKDKRAVEAKALKLALEEMGFSDKG